jgi:hypothetical protein
METGKEPDPDWLTVAADDVRAAGYRNMVYGSVSTLFGQPQRSGYVVANPTGVVHMYPVANVQGTQWKFDQPVPGGTIDEDVLAKFAVQELWLP